LPVLLILAMLLAVVLLNLPSGGFLRRVAFPVALVLFLAEIWFALWPSSVETLGWPAAVFGITPLADSLTRVLVLSIGVVAFASLLVGRGTIGDEARRFNFINLLLLAVAGMNGVVAVSDLFTLYIFIEVTATASFVLIVFNKGKDAYEGAFKYFLLSAVATALILAGIGILVMYAGGTSFQAVKAALAGPESGSVARLAVLLFMGGLFIKSGLVPFHGWLPDAYSTAPNAVSVFLAGIVTKTTGVYALIRLTSDVFGLGSAVTGILLVVGTLSIFVGALAALGQSDFKRLLAYSSISQVGYIIVGLGAGNQLGVAGAIFHLFNHSIFKSLLFVNAASVEEATGTVDIRRLGGLSSRMRYTGITSLVGFLSAAGIPPLSGFWSKLIIIVALFQAGHPYFASLAILGSLITLAYFLVLQRRVFFGEVAAGLEEVKDPGAWFAVPSIVLAAIVVCVGVFFPYLVRTILVPVQAFIW
jgi:proton-translocating NADH-quinone oxidoreductase chain N